MTSGAPAKYEAAWWALEHGLVDEAIEMVHSAAQSDPSFKSSTRLVAIVNLLRAPCSDPRLDAVRAALPGRFQEANSEHFLLLHQHSPAEAKRRLADAERILAAFYLWFGGLGIDLDPPRERLISVWIARDGDYAAFLSSLGSGAMAATRGYYHPTANLVATVDESNHPEFRAAIAKRATRTNSDLKALEERRRAIELATLAHETVHQLVARSGLAPRDDAFPLWLHEGLAMQFEATECGEWAGLCGVNDLRLAASKSLHPLPSLARIVSDADYEPGFQSARYAAAWSLVEFLRTEHRAEWVTYLDQLRLPDGESVSPAERFLNCFRVAFGDDLDRLERAWRAHLHAQQERLHAEIGATRQ
jgi:hypothetical protein